MMVVVNDPTIESFDRIRGALILLGAFVVYLPLRLLLDLNDTLLPLFEKSVWQSLTVPGNSDYHYMWKPYLLFQLGVHVLFVIVAVIALVLFFAKDVRFRKTFIAFLISALFVSVIGYLLIKDIPNADKDSSLKGVLYNAVKFFGVVSYLIMSKRVKGTFTNRITFRKRHLESDAHITSG